MGDVRPAQSGADGIGVELRSALRRLAKAVVIITTKYDGVRHAMAATAVSELSFDPPSMLACVNRSASIHPALAAGAPFCINILHASHEPLARTCSGALKGEARFESGDWTEAANGAPYLKDAQASIICDADASHMYGSHSIFIGRVRDVHISGDIGPLVYMDGGYRVVA